MLGVVCCGERQIVSLYTAPLAIIMMPVSAPQGWRSDIGCYMDLRVAYVNQRLDIVVQSLLMVRCIMTKSCAQGSVIELSLTVRPQVVRIRSTAIHLRVETLFLQQFGNERQNTVGERKRRNTIRNYWMAEKYRHNKPHSRPGSRYCPHWLLIAVCRDESKLNSFPFWWRWLKTSSATLCSALVVSRKVERRWCFNSTSFLTHCLQWSVTVYK